MKFLKRYLILSFCFCYFSYAQKKRPVVKVQEAIVFKDTVCNIAFDSINHNFGRIDPVIQSTHLIKRFKYIGKEPVVIVKAWSGDPHFICDYPNEPLLPNKIYSYTVCFSFYNGFGKMDKTMGFTFSNGKVVRLHFKAEFIPLKKIMTALGPFRLF